MYKNTTILPFHTPNEIQNSFPMCAENKKNILTLDGINNISPFTQLKIGINN